MGWQERNYDNRINYGGNPFTHPLLRLIFGSVYIGTLFRVRIRIHASLLWYIGLSLAFSGGHWSDVLLSCGALFGIVFLHEFGHCFACRSVGGDADEIMMWMLGGLAMARPPRRPWPQFVTVAGGPLVNVVIFTVLTGIIYATYHIFPPLNPLVTFIPAVFLDYFAKQSDAAAHNAAYQLYVSGHVLFWIYMTNWSILFFNMIPMYPLDGGQMLQAILWKPLGYVKSMKIACYTGIVFSVLVALFAVQSGAFFLLIIAAFSFMGSYQQLRLLKMSAMEDDTDPYDLSAAWEQPDRPTPPGRKRKKLRKGWFRAVRKQASREQAEQARIDAILAKVKEKGLHSLSWWDKRALKKATARQRQQDLAERL